ncbi:MAG TPA: gluconokinase [Chryseolinea sp.]|nr:gluconokinase [Chryseolinea sp.]
MGYIVGIDIGTGSTKAVAVDTAGKVIEVSKAAYPTIQSQPTYSEQAPELIWQAFIKCISRISVARKEPPLAVVLSSAMHSVIPVDKAGDPLMNMITWADNRSAEIAERIKKSNDGETLYTQNGTPIHAMTPLCKIVWLKENAASIFRDTSKFLSIKEFIWHKLFDVYEVDFSIASATGMFNIMENRWNQQALDICGISPDQLSLPVPTYHRREGLKTGVDGLLKISRDTPFVIGASDGCLANIGSFAIEPGVAALTIGTSGAIRVACEKPVTNFKAMTFNYRMFDNLFVSGGPINNGGVALKWYAESFLKLPLNTPADYDMLLDAIKDIEPGAKGLIFLPYILGERAPIWNSNSSGVFFGVRNYHTQAHFTRAVLEGISMALYSIMKAMEETGQRIHKIHVSGGFVHSTGWLQILSDIFNKPIVLIHDEDASAIGGAFLGLKILGMIEDYHALDTGEHSTFRPNEKNHMVYRKIFSVYESLYEKTKDEMNTLAELAN